MNEVEGRGLKAGEEPSMCCETGEGTEGSQGERCCQFFERDEEILTWNHPDRVEVEEARVSRSPWTEAM